MKLTPLDIKKQEFRKGIRGYDPIEVEAFLEVVADEFEAIVREKNQLTDEVLKLRTQLKDYRQVEDSLKETLVNAQENLNSSRENSKKEADLIIRDAELQAEKILDDSRMKLEKLKNDIVLIRAQKESFARRLRHLLESQMELIGVLELEDMGYEEPRPQQQEEVQDKKAKLNRLKNLNRTGSVTISMNENNDAAEAKRGSGKNKEASKNSKNAKLPRIKDQYLT